MAGLDEQFKKRREAAAAPAEAKPTKTAVYVDPDDYRRARIWCAQNNVTFTALMAALLHRHLDATDAAQAKVAADAKAMGDQRRGR